MRRDAPTIAEALPRRPHLAWRVLALVWSVIIFAVCLPAMILGAVAFVVRNMLAWLIVGAIILFALSVAGVLH